MNPAYHTNRPFAADSAIGVPAPMLNIACPPGVNLDDDKEREIARELSSLRAAVAMHETAIEILAARLAPALGGPMPTANSASDKAEPASQLGLVLRETADRIRRQTESINDLAARAQL